jgi:hypothetical protein
MRSTPHVLSEPLDTTGRVGSPPLCTPSREPWLRQGNLGVQRFLATFRIVAGSRPLCLLNIRRVIARVTGSVSRKRIHVFSTSERETPPRGRRRAGDTLAGGVGGNDSQPNMLLCATAGCPRCRSGVWRTSLPRYEMRARCLSLPTSLRLSTTFPHGHLLHRPQRAVLAMRMRSNSRRMLAHSILRHLQIVVPLQIDPVTIRRSEVHRQ